MHQLQPMSTNVTFIKTVISISANYTKDAILQSTICEHTNTTTDRDIGFLNNLDNYLFYYVLHLRKNNL